MKLFELGVSKPSKQAAKVFESYFGDSINVDVISAKQAHTMLGKVRKLVNEHKATAAYHKSEQNPTYLKLMMMERVLAAKVKEGGETVGLGVQTGANKNQEVAQTTAPGVNPTVAADSQNTQQQQKQNAQAQSGGVNTVNPANAAIAGATGAAMMAKKDAAAASAGATSESKLVKLQKATNAVARGTATMEQRKLVTKAAMVNESFRRKIYHLLRESEVQQAQVVLAAQDMVDNVQKMSEQVSSMQFKDLPALCDQIKNQVGVDQAMQFNTDATAALAGLLQNLQGAKQQLDQALGVVTGQAAPAVPGMDDMDAGMGGELPDGDGMDDLGGEPGMGDEPDMGLDDEPEEPSLGGAGLGREKR